MSEAQVDLQYPIGRFHPASEITGQQRQQWIAEIATAPARVREAVRGLSNEQLDTPYRSGGWTVRQVVHHVPDSHMNAYVRFRLSLTEDEPTIKPYEEQLWAELPDARTAEIEISLALLENLHLRWVRLLESMTAEQWRRTYRHPQMGVMPLEQVLGMYAWHGKHHAAHITGLRERMKW